MIRAVEGGEEFQNEVVVTKVFFERHLYPVI